MANIQLRGPDGACRQPNGNYGRNDFGPAGHHDATISRQQFSLKPVENALILTCHGTNGAQTVGCIAGRCIHTDRLLCMTYIHLSAAMVVEVLAPDDQAGGDQWQTAEYVEQGESTVVGPSMRFYVCGRYFRIGSHFRLGASCLTWVSHLRCTKEPILLQ